MFCHICVSTCLNCGRVIPGVVSGILRPGGESRARVPVDAGLSNQCELATHYRCH